MPDFRCRLGKEILIFDGACGTVLQSRGLPRGARPEDWCLTHPDEVVRLHRGYIAAGADIIKTNTFGANTQRYPDGAGYTVEEIVTAATDCASRAVSESGDGRNIYTALDIGPLGRLMRPTGDMDFEEAVDAFARTVRAGADRCDLILLETFGDLAEARAALIAAKENCCLPVVVTNVYGTDGRLFTGPTAEAVCVALEGLGADAVGMNCSIGPDEMLKILPELTRTAHIPVAVNPNAGLPRVGADGQTVYDLTPEHFAGVMTGMAACGATLLGGCCGTTPEHIACLREKTRKLQPAVCRNKSGTTVSSASRVYRIGERLTVIGERINPTGKPKLKAALREGRTDYLLGEAYSQMAAGADILDVNVGLPEIDEKAELCRAVEAIQTVCGLPLQIDTADPAAMEAALRRYNGRALINSVNGSEKSMSEVLPLAAKYGGVLIALTLDGDGIPDTPRGRLEIARRIIRRAEKYGICRDDIIVDPLTLTLGTDPDAANKTLEAVRLIRGELGVFCSLGISNISFGMPERERINCGFLAEAMKSGLDAAIMNPLSAPMMSVARGEADASGFGTGNYTATGSVTAAGIDTGNLTDCVYGGLKSQSIILAETAMKETAPAEVIGKLIIPALDRAGREFASGSMFLPGLLACADAAIAALGVISEELLKRGDRKASRGKIVLATVEGDVHDIGKNIVGVMLKSYGFEVIDLGRNVPSAEVVRAANESKALLVGLSALMTTTLPAMGRTLAALHESCPEVKTVVGGAVLTAEYAAVLGADRYAADAMATVRYAEEVYG